MNPAKTDIDIDFADRDKALAGLTFASASIRNKQGQYTRHPSGVYFQDIPLNPLTELSAFDYRDAEENGYFKIDFLNQSVYAEIEDEAHLDRLLHAEPMWELLEERELVEQLMHIHGHYDVVQTIAPRSIQDLAVVLALIRPGKKHLVNRPRTEIDAQIWQKTGDEGYVFRKAHAISYAALIVVQMNLLIEKLSAELSAGDDGLISI